MDSYSHSIYEMHPKVKPVPEVGKTLQRLKDLEQESTHASFSFAQVGNHIDLRECMNSYTRSFPHLRIKAVGYGALTAVCGVDSCPARLRFLSPEKKVICGECEAKVSFKNAVLSAGSPLYVEAGVGEDPVCVILDTSVDANWLFKKFHPTISPEDFFNPEIVDKVVFVGFFNLI